MRGVIGESLTPNLLTRFAQAFGTYVNAGTVVIGRDPRTSGEMVRQAVIAGLLSSGCRVIDLEVCPVPTVQLLVRHLHAQGGIAITASHNPAEWNALKFIGADGLFLGAGYARELLDIYHQGDYSKVASAEVRGVELYADAIDLHINKILDAVGSLPQTDKRLKVVVDCCNGAGSIIAPKLLVALGVDVIAINDTPDGLFPRPAEPVPENLGDLCAAVRAHNADIGFAQDMDADRLAVVSNEGHAIGEDYTLALSVRHVLAEKPGTVVVSLSTSHVLEAVTARFNSQLIRTKTGEAHVTERMQREGAIIGGEGNGGVIFPRINFARDSLVGMALILHLLAKERRRLTDILAELPRKHIIKEKIVCPSDKIADVLKAVQHEYAAYPTSVLDGIKVTLPDGWFLVRGSNTEPIMRVIAEADSHERAIAIVHTVFTFVRTRINS